AEIEVPDPDGYRAVGQHGRPAGEVLAGPLQFLRRDDIGQHPQWRGGGAGPARGQFVDHRLLRLAEVLGLCRTVQARQRRVEDVSGCHDAATGQEGTQVPGQGPGDLGLGGFRQAQLQAARDGVPQVGAQFRPAVRGQDEVYAHSETAYRDVGHDLL